MPEDEQERGRIAHERLSALLTQLDWSEQNSNVDIPCTSGVHTERSKDHGVDGYFAYDDPYQEPERGVFVESKMRQWSSLNATEVGDAVKQSLQVVECVPEADEFQTKLNYDENRNYRYGIVGIWSSDEFDEVDFQSYVSQTSVRRRSRGTYKIAVLGNTELNRLARVAKQYEELEEGDDPTDNSIHFYYPSMVDKPYPHIRNCLSLEYMTSDIIFAQIEDPTTVDGDRVGADYKTVAFHFGDFTVEALDVLFQSLVAYGMLDEDEVHIYYDNEDLDRGVEEIESAKRLFRQNVAPEQDESPEFSFKQLPSVSYDTYTDRLRDEQS